ncbi:MAG TPA: outer membrane lipoprotein-sorting protein [Candidatus Acidoferrum sp.]|jgi:hypothetical protein|nr:outer membrane lipoprotein-sorting protein [Candidatus Acidoferrum sp.]
MNRVFLTLASILFFALAATAQTTNNLSDAEIQGQQLAQEILQNKPVTNFTQKGILRIRNSKGATTNIPVTIDTFFNGGNKHWTAHYDASPTTNPLTSIKLDVIYQDGQSNLYYYFKPDGVWPLKRLEAAPSLNETQIMTPFADSDFWIADLGLEFFHWPEQKVLKHETRRTRACTVLESTNPDPSPGSYSHVDSWIDDESHGIVHAEAYDANGKLLKVFDPKSFKKVNGQWELQDMEIRNVQTGSRTWIKFDLSGKS